MSRLFFKLIAGGRNKKIGSGNEAENLAHVSEGDENEHVATLTHTKSRWFLVQELPVSNVGLLMPYVSNVVVGNI